MSLKATRYEKIRVPFRNRRRANRDVHCKGASKVRADDQNMVTRLAMETNEVVEGGVLESIFGSSSVAHALSVALRVKRAKGRDATVSTWENSFKGSNIKSRRRLRGRNIHHMTPKSRKGQAFFGNGKCNLLLLKVSRHDLLHKEFGVRTWEEIIILLSRCVRIAWHASFGAMIDALVPAPPRNRMHRRMVRRALHNFQFSHESPGWFGAFYC